MTHRRGTSRRRGVALVMVLGAVAAVFVVGMAILNGLPASTRASSNLADHARAMYLAECGLVEGLDRLEHPPVADEIWPGITGRTIDDSGATYDLIVTDLGGGEYRLTATAHVPGRHGQTVTHARAMDVDVQMLDRGYRFDQSTVLGSGLAIPAAAEIEGDVHANHNVWLMGEVTGKLSASGYILPLGGEAESYEPNADHVDLPEVDFDAYNSYSHNGATGQARVIDPADATEQLHDIEPVTADNPLGVVIVDGDLSFDDSLAIKGGILVVRGDLEVNRHDVQVDGMEGHISLLVEGNVRFVADGDLEVNNGPAYLGRYLFSKLGATGMKADFQAGLITARGLPLAFGGTIEIRNKPLEDNGTSNIRYFGDGAGVRRAITLLGYSPNAGS